MSARGERPPTPPCHHCRRLCAGQAAASRRPLQRVPRCTGTRPFSLRTAWARPSSLWPRYAATPSPDSRPVASALRGAATCCRWPTREAAMLISAAAASNQRLEPLAGCLGTAHAAGLGAARPRGAAGAAHAGVDFLASTEALLGAAGGQPRRRCKASRPSSGAGSAASGTETKGMCSVVVCVEALGGLRSVRAATLRRRGCFGTFSHRMSGVCMYLRTSGVDKSVLGLSI